MSSNIVQTGATHFTIMGLNCAVCKSNGMKCNRYEIFNFNPTMFEDNKKMLEYVKRIKKECVGLSETGSRRWWNTMIDQGEVSLQVKDYDSICKEFRIKPQLDVCATVKNTKCVNYITKEQDALKQDWLVNDEVVEVYCNPPAGHSKGTSTGMKNFVIKAHEQWVKHNMRIIIFLTDAAYGAKYFWDCVKKYNKAFGDECVQIETLIHRPKMLDQYGSINGCTNKGIIVVVFNKYMGETTHLTKSKVVSRWLS